MFVESYLFFDGRCDEAIKFYTSAIGAETQMLLRFKDAPPEAKAGCTPGTEEKVMHANVKIRDTRVNMSDGRGHGQPKFEGFAMTLNAKDAVDADMLFAALSEGGQVQMPMSETFFAHRFGMVIDKFGVMWMVLFGKG
jgi:PhnB protein